MKHLFFTALLFSIFGACCFSQNYFPHAIGNKWVYKRLDTVQPSISYFTREIGGDTVMLNGKKYFRYESSPYFAVSFARVDSNSLYFYNTYTNAEGRVYRFDAKVGDQWDVPEIYYMSPVVVQGRDSVTIFSKKVKTIIYVGSYPRTTYTFAETFGIIKELMPTPYQPPGTDYTLTTLQGCIINGVTYGDLTSVEKIQSAVPERVNLFPSYPNPFNGQTTIRFSLDRREHLRLAIYDILGREVAVLVEKELEAGVYNTQWSAGYVGSGVYLVRLQTSKNLLTQKVIYLK